MSDSTFDFDEAMRIYLGGDPNSGDIEIGQGDSRLRVRYGTEAMEIQRQLDGVLGTVSELAGDSAAIDGLPIASWIASQLPSLSPAACAKIESYVIFLFEH